MRCVFDKDVHIKMDQHLHSIAARHFCSRPLVATFEAAAAEMDSVPRQKVQNIESLCCLMEHCVKDAEDMRRPPRLVGPIWQR